MKFMATVLFAIASLLPLTAQTAKVIPLSPADAQYAKYLYEQKASVEKQITTLEEHVRKTYLYNSDHSGYTCLASGNTWVLSSTGSCSGSKLGTDQFEYSEDFKYIVPKPYQGGGSGSIWTSPCWNNGTNYVIPATGNLTFTSAVGSSDSEITDSGLRPADMAPPSTHFNKDGTISAN